MYFWRAQEAQKARCVHQTAGRSRLGRIQLLGDSERLKFIFWMLRELRPFAPVLHRSHSAIAGHRPQQINLLMVKLSNRR